MKKVNKESNFERFTSNSLEQQFQIKCSTFLFRWFSQYKYYLALISRIGGAVVNDNFMYPTKLSEILRFPENLLIRQSWRKSDDENKIPLNDANVGKVLPVLRDLLLLGLKRKKKIIWNWNLDLNLKSFLDYF